MEYSCIHNHQSQFLEWFGGDKFVSTTLPEISENMDYKRVPITSGDRNVGQFPYYGASGIVDYIDNYIFDEPLLLVSEDGANLKDRVTPIAFIAEGKYWVNNHAHVLKFTNFANMTYICHFFNFTNIEKYLTGMAQPKLNQAQLNTIKIPWPPVKMQEQFAALVEQADKSKFDGFKSQFLEWFGNVTETTSLCEICRPKQWPTIQTKDFTDNGYLVYGANGVIGHYSSYNHEHPTILIACRGASCGAINISEPHSYITGNAMCLDNLSDKVQFEYLAYFLTQYNFSSIISGGAQPQITYTNLQKVEVPIVPIESQSRFVAFYRQADKSKYYEINETIYGIL